MGFETAIKQKKITNRPGKPYFLMGVLTIVVLVLGAFLQEGIAFFNQPYNSLMEDIEFYCVFTVHAIALVFYFILVFRYYRLKPHFGWMAVFIALFIGNLLAIYHFPETVSGTTVPIHSDPFDFEYTLEAHFRLRYVLSFLAACVDLYIVFAIAPRIYRSARSLSWIFYSFILITIFAIFYSIVMERDVYSYYLDPGQPASAGAMVVLSFFNNRNTFSMVLLLAMAAVGILHSDSHRFWHFILLFIFYVEIFFTLSKTGIIVGTFYLFAFAFYRFFRNISFHKVRAILGLTIFFALFIAFILIGHFQLLPRDTIFVKMYTNFASALSRQIDNGFLDYRIEIWQNCQSFLDGDKYFQLFGVGDINALVLLKYMWNRTEVDFYYTHNGFVHQLFAGGYLRLLIYIGMLVYFFVVFVVNMTRGKRATFAYFLASITLILQGITETTSLLSIETKGYFFPLVFIVPMLVEYHKGNKESVEEEMRHQFSKAFHRYSYDLSPTRKAIVATLPLLPMAFFFLGAVPMLSHLKMIWFYQYDKWILQLTFILLLVYAPISMYFLSIHKGWKFVVLLVLNYLLIGAGTTAMLLRPMGVNLLVIGVVFAIMLAFLVLFAIRKLPRLWLIKVFGALLPVWAVALLFVGVNHYFAYVGQNLFLVDGVAFDSATLNVSIMVGEVLLFLLLTFGLLPFRPFSFPLEHLLFRLDNLVSAYAQSIEDKAALREQIHHGDYVKKYYKSEIKNWRFRPENFD